MNFGLDLLSPDCLFLHLSTFNPFVHPNHLRGSPWQLRSHNLTDFKGPKNLMDRHVLQTTELRRKRKKCFSAENGTKWESRRLFTAPNCILKIRCPLHSLHTHWVMSQDWPQYLQQYLPQNVCPGPSPIGSKQQPPSATSSADTMQYYESG